MKKFMALLLVAGMTLSLTACGGSTDTAKTDQADGKDTFTVGFDQDFPPFGYVGDDGEFTGFDIEMATECAARMGKKIVLQPIDWDAKDMELEAGTIDCIWNGFTMNGREDQYTWTDPYMDNSQVVVVKKDSGINTLADLAALSTPVVLAVSAKIPSPFPLVHPPCVTPSLHKNFSLPVSIVIHSVLSTSYAVLFSCFNALKYSFFIIIVSQESVKC